MPTPEEERAAAEAAAQEAAKAAADEEAKRAAAQADDEAKKAQEAKDAEEAARAAAAAKPPDDGAEPSGAEKRIRELVAKQREAERQAEYYRGLAEGRVAAKPPDPPEPQKPAGPPRPEDFEGEGPGKGYDAYLIALAEYRYEQKAEARKRAEDEAKQKEAVAKAQEMFAQRLNKAAETDPEILTIASDKTLPVSAAMAEIIRESELSPKLLRHLSDHRDEALKIFKMPPLAAARELGRIEAKILSTPPPAPPRRVSQAPEPITPLTSAGPIEIDLDKIPIDDFMKKRNAAQFGGARG